MARSLMYLFLAGATITLLSVALPEIRLADEPRIIVTGVSGYAIGATLLVGYDRLPAWAFQLFLACATLLIEWTIYASGEPTSAYAMFYFWIAIYSFYFFTRLQAILQMVFVGLAYASVVAFVDELRSAPVLHWAIATSALVVAGAMVGLLKENVDRLIAKLAAAARTDTLTGLVNRRGFHELFETELERAHRSGAPLTVILGDLDGFKAVNDRFGHHAGDRALERFSSILQGAKRRIDAAARLGGEEFALIVPDTDEHGAYILAERVRRQVRDGFSDERVPLTISLGIASFPAHGGSTEGMLHAADQALYAAKELGRDRTVIYSAEVAAGLLAASSRRAAQREGHLATVLSLAEVLDLRDSGTALHSQTVGRYAEAIARELGLPPVKVERVRLGGIVHDVGKIVVPDAVLRKPGPLTEDDWVEMYKHPETGARILQGAYLEDIASWVLAHHERPDGRGYPRGLPDEDIPLEAKILAVADAYEAMTADRVYRPALGHPKAREELRQGAGTQFDEQVVEALLAALETVGDEALTPSES